MRVYFKPNPYSVSEATVGYTSNFKEFMLRYIKQYDWWKEITFNFGEDKCFLTGIWGNNLLFECTEE